ncbi:6-phosphofructokinase [Clostridium thermarum]|uniref:6-phosphofructokinase n=1 Tax=Clostridium thermarum TaxID=1716543 RepID=UPI0013D63525|nr:6-phosphofructokinase [Clostridium thermarum]
MRTIAVMTSGGDAPGMNAAIRAVVRVGLDKGLRVKGVQRGYKGLINGEIFDMNRSAVAEIIQKGGTILKTSSCDEFRTPEARERSANVLRLFGIDGLVVIGGDGAFAGASLLSKLGVAAVAIPGTIDNDLGYTDYTIGFDTALNTVIEAINKLRDTANSHNRVSIVEVMGRGCGEIALYGGLAGGAESILIPEKDFDKNEICKKIFQGKSRGKLHHLVLVAEGVCDTNELAREIEEITGVETRTTILGHIQRGGNPSAFDRILASRMGEKAVELLLEGKTSSAVGIRKGEIIDMDIDVALSVPRVFNEKIYNMMRILSS